MKSERLYTAPARGPYSSKTTGSLDPGAEVYVTARDEAAYADILRKAVTAPDGLSQAERGVLRPVDCDLVDDVNTALAKWRARR